MGGRRSRPTTIQQSFVAQENNQSMETTSSLVRLSVYGTNEMQMNQVGLSIVPFAKANVIFFPGDVQDFQQEMSQGSFRDFSQEYSYEQMPSYLRAQFGNDVNVWIIRPAMIQPLGYSCYQHFVANCHPQYGSVESYDPNGQATIHLMALMKNVCTQIGVELKEQIDLLNRPLHLVGFSKGAIVLNQLISEMSASGTSAFGTEVSGIASFYHTIASCQWLGGGNGSKRGAFPLFAVPNTGSRIQYGIHITPYQLYSNERPWIREEMQQFMSQLQAKHIPVSSRVYFEHEPPSLQRHFQLLQVWQLEYSPNRYASSSYSSGSSNSSSNSNSTGTSLTTGHSCGFNTTVSSSSSTSSASSTSDVSSVSVEAVGAVSTGSVLPALPIILNN